MNANEQSQDYKRGYNAGFEAGELNGKNLSATMLRQQQAEIEAYKIDHAQNEKAKAFLYEQLDGKDREIESLTNCIHLLTNFVADTEFSTKSVQNKLKETINTRNAVGE